jgi:hypothetical protein
MRFPVLPLILWFGALTRCAHADQIVLAPDRDNTLYSEDGTLSNGAGQGTFSGQTRRSGARRALLRFDISALPSGSQNVSGSLELTCTRSISQAIPCTLHRVTADWGEAASDAGEPGGSGAPAEPGDATWTHRFFDSTIWTTPGGDFFATPTSTTNIAGPDLYVFADLAADIEFWQVNPDQNFGWIIIGDESQPTSAKRFGSRENLDPLVRPKLTIVFDPPPCPGDVTGDGIVDLTDLTTLLAHFGMLSGAVFADGDMDGDGDVDLGDLTVLLSQFGISC